MAVRLIGLGGWKASGKDTVAGFIAEQTGAHLLGMSDRLLETALMINPVIFTDPDPDHAELKVGERDYLAEIVEDLGWAAAKEIPKVREFLVRLGDSFRLVGGQNILVDDKRSVITELLTEGISVVLTGVRLPQEIAMVESLGGATVWVDRPMCAPAAGAHLTETSLGPDDFQYLIENIGTLEQLQQRTIALLGGIVLE